MGGRTGEKREGGFHAVMLGENIGDGGMRFDQRR